MPWQLGPFGSNPGDFWTLLGGPIAVYVTLTLDRWPIIEIQERNGELVELLCVTDDNERGLQSAENEARYDPDAMPERFWNRVKRIPKYILESEDTAEKLKGPLNRAGPGQDWYAEITPPEAARHD
jgi:hypothetical protein